LQVRHENSMRLRKVPLVPLGLFLAASALISGA
jgi:hypothetical protein